MTTPSPFVLALRGALALIAAAPVEPRESSMAKKIARDIEQGLARLEGKEATEADLISIVCHDLKDPLASIVMGAGFLRKTIPAEDGAARRVVEAIARSTERMSQVIGDFHDLAKLEAGRITLDLRPWDVIPVLHGTVTSFESKAKERGVRLELDAPPPPLIALVDRTRIQQVISKLVGNAIKFTNPDGRIVVRAEAQPGPAARTPERGDEPADGSLGAVRISVSDTGRGIPAERLQSIFDHSANARRTPRDGPGLGLAIAQGFLALQGRKIEVESHVDKGSVFSFTLPASTAAGPQAPPPFGPPRPLPT
jgi:signal transduction histidine kinase